MTPRRWAILTGEYPPQTGGVSDYTHQLAHALADAGDEVHIWAPACIEPDQADTAVQIHRLPDHFGPRGLLMLRRQLKCLPRPFRLLVQYVPHAYGYKAMNLPLCFWLATRDRQDELWVQFHEVAYPFERGQPARHRLLAYVTHLMAWRLARSAERNFITTPAWLPRIGRWSRTNHPVTWQPVPSNLPIHADPSRIREIRQTLAPGGILIGHFGTFGQAIAGMLRALLPPLLQDHPDRRVLLIGRGGELYLKEFLNAWPQLAGQIIATGGLPPQEAADHLGSCDVMLQPYADGATCRRGTLMAPLALGRAIVTTRGMHSEPFWHESGAVALAPADSPPQIIAEVERLLNEPQQRQILECRAAQKYRESFALEHTVAALRRQAEDASIRGRA